MSRFCRPIAIFIVGVVAAFPVLATADDSSPQISVGFPRWGGTPRVIEHTWTSLPFQLTNPADAAQQLNLTIHPENESGTVYQKVLRIGPTAAVSNQMLITAQRTQDYRAVLTTETQAFLAQQQIKSDYQGIFYKRAFYFISDDPELTGVSDLTKLDSLILSPVITRSSAKDAPKHWAEFGGASVVVLVGTDFTRFTAPNYQALADFVESGGTLLVLAPRTVLDAAATPLRPMLPVIPLQIREIEELPVPICWQTPGESSARQPVIHCPTAIDFIEAVTADNAQVTAAMAEFPLIAWRRHGLGTVGVMAVSPFAESIRDSSYNGNIWNHLLSWSDDHPLSTHALHSAPLQHVTSRLIGFSVPSAVVIRNILLGYAALVLLVFLLCYILHRPVLAWPLNGLMAILLTVGLFQAAYRQTAERPEKTLTTLELRCQGPSRLATTKTVTFFSKKDDRPVLQGTARNVHFRMPPPAPSPVPTASHGQTLIEVQRNEDVSTVTRFAVHALKTASIALVARHDLATPAPAAVAQIKYGNGLPEIPPFQLPPGIPEEARGYVVFAQGIVPLKIRNRTCSADYNAAKALTLDTAAQDFERFLTELSMATPSLAFIYRQAGDSPEFNIVNNSYSEVRHTIHLYGMQEMQAPESVLVIPEQIAVVPADKSARTLLWNNQWQEAFMYGGASSYDFAAVLPRSLGQMVADEVTIDIEILNPGGTLKPALALLTSDGRGVAIGPTAVSGGKFKFSDLGAHRVVDPVTGRIIVRLTMASDSNGGDAGSSLGATVKWQMNSFRITAQGQLTTAKPTVF